MLTGESEVESFTCTQIRNYSQRDSDPLLTVTLARIYG